MVPLSIVNFLSSSVTKYSSPFLLVPAADEEFGEEDHPIYEEGDTFQEVSEIIHKEPDHCQEEEEEACQEEEAEARQEEEAEARQEKGADPYNYDYPLKEGRQLHETDEDKDDDGENTDADLH